MPLRAEPDVDATIAKARAHLGEENQLKAVKTIHFVGSFEAPQTGATGQIEILLKKPFMQSKVVVSDNVVETTAINDYEGWQRVFNQENPNTTSFAIMSAPDLKRMRASTVENLYFYTGYTKMRGKVIDKGVVSKDGRQTHLLRFSYGPNLYYDRYIDVETGELITSIDNYGLEYKEVGEIRVEGILFPEKVVTLFEGEIINTVSFEEVKVNEEIPDEIFGMPDLAPPKRSDEE